MRLENFIEKFNEGDLDFLKWFGDIDDFLDLVEKNKKWYLLDLDRMEDDYPNYLMLHLYNNRKDGFNKKVLSSLTDVELIDGVWYWVGDRKDLAQLFCDNRRNSLSRNTVEEILDGTLEIHTWWSAYDLTDNVYRDVIQELTKENLIRLKEYVIDTLKGKKISPNTDVLESIAQRENTEFVTVNESNIDEIIDDEETMVELMKDELEELKRELYSIYGSSYESAYEEELIDEVSDELGRYFDMKQGKYTTRPHSFRANTEVERYQVPIWHFEKNILEYLNYNKKYSSETLDYRGTYVDLLSVENECLDTNPPDYPDSRLIDKNINSFFNDYI